jgi:hypothetical protein
MNNGLPQIFLSHWLAAAMQATASKYLYYGLFPMLSYNLSVFKILNNMTNEE